MGSDHDPGAFPVDPDQLLRWAETLSAIARTGLGFTQSEYERERFDEILAVASDIRASADMSSVDIDSIDRHGTDGRSVDTNSADAGRADRTSDASSAAVPIRPSAGLYQGEWMKVIGSGVAGYVTPKVAIGAVVGDDDGRLLLIQRADSGIWLYPTGWADVGYSPAEVAVKEVQEETGIHCEVIRPLGIFDGLRLGFSRIPLYTIVFHCHAVGGTLRPHPQECLDVGWFTQQDLPSPVATFDRWGAMAFAAIRGEPVDTAFDPPRNPIWRR